MSSQTLPETPAEDKPITRVQLSGEDTTFAAQALQALGTEPFHQSFWAGRRQTAPGEAQGSDAASTSSITQDKTYWSYKYPNEMYDLVSGDIELRERATVIQKYVSHTGTSGDSAAAHRSLFRPLPVATCKATCKKFDKDRTQIGTAWPVSVTYTLEAQAQLSSTFSEDEKAMLAMRLGANWSAFGLAGNSSQFEEGRAAEDDYPPFSQMYRRESEGILNDQVSVSVPDTPQPWSYETEFLLNDHSKGSIVNTYAKADADISTFLTMKVYDVAPES
ncbi:hypothetical protein L198_00014 [Cryptococcus wingfieldii CBS 7118]|uniref:Uncharacterized protein n=1 Tax=Cryptococcus wingfieldii CBS 7118 TaxID=1295528 RepID=A0A1E3K5F4_9TREE|nr:hypothetical protein L198_00014 [Cryptococcus wingfieldii CBS 7118]ODO08291.1 hypothetical protein L198_00014 [Cryptococcus wingfieldii CBS 7118]